MAARRSRGRPYPERCPACRTRRLAAWLAEGPAAAPPVRATRAPGPDGGAGQLHPAVCADCGRAIRLPFRPSPDRPVFCRDCMETRAGR